MKYQSESPRDRSRLRLGLGKSYFTLLRYLKWLVSRQEYAHHLDTANILPYNIYHHQTPLLRQLRNVDMWMQYNKIVNLKLAIAKINGIILKPGQTFSFWRIVGKPTRRKGYQQGMVLCNGGFYPDTGGGLCQLSNLIYWMTLHTPLTVIERWRHNYDVFPDSNRTQPFGSGATVSYNYIDLQIRNNTSQDYQLLVWVDDEYLQGEWRSNYLPEKTYQVYEKESCIKGEWWGGYTRNNVLYRKVYDSHGREIDDEYICTNQAIMMYEPLLSPSPLEKTNFYS